MAGIRHLVHRLAARLVVALDPVDQAQRQPLTPEPGHSDPGLPRFGDCRAPGWVPAIGQAIDITVAGHDAGLVICYDCDRGEVLRYERDLEGGLILTRGTMPRQAAVETARGRVDVRWKPGTDLALRRWAARVYSARSASDESG